MKKENYLGLWFLLALFLAGCGGSSTTETTSALTLEPIANQKLIAPFAPRTIQVKVTQPKPEPYHFYVESSNDALVVATITDDGELTLSPASTTTDTGESTIEVIAFTLFDVDSLEFNVTVSRSTSTAFSMLSFKEVSQEEWTPTAVQKVLDTFAYGGHASDNQIETWSKMAPHEAIVEMLQLNASNPKLSPNSDPLFASISLEEQANFWSGDDSRNFVDAHYKDYFIAGDWDGIDQTWIFSTLTRGLNPFLYKVGVWESNYHMSANRNAGVYPYPMFHHYDNILAKLSANEPYERVMAQGAENAAIAYQYGHNRNIYKDGVFRGNEDFAREYHQLFFGILGGYDPLYHEETSIPNTARALTDMQAKWHPTDEGGPDREITFGTEYHYTPDVEIIHHTISGATAKEKIEAIAKVDIAQDESLDNLPVMIISHFADDNLSEDKIGRIRSSWRAMSTKELLPFLWAYAVSTDFHSPSRYKFESTIQRNMRVTNKLIVDNSDLKYLTYNPFNYLYKEGIRLFRPIHDVFGHQTSIEASDNANIFRLTYNRSAKPYSITQYYRCKRDSNNECIKDENGIYEAEWEKDWAKIISSEKTNGYTVEEVGKWLWQRFISDDLKHYGTLERAHIVSLLNGRDLAVFLDDENPLKIYSIEDLESDSSVKRRLQDGAVEQMNLNSSDINDRRLANRFIGRAIAFIVATPYIYAQEGK
jgi:hypothetical protein